MKHLEKRPEVSKKVLEIVAAIVDSQDAKGWVKYLKTIDDAHVDPETGEEYNWEIMALEEMVDGMKYAVKRNIQLLAANKQLAKLSDDLEAENRKMKAEGEKLGDFILKWYSHEIGLGNPKEGESAADVAIRLLKESLGAKTMKREPNHTFVRKQP